MLDFIASFQSLVLATLDEHKRPFTSYAPFVYHEHATYIFISDIATHAKNLKANSEAALLFIEDESKSANIFARKRISMQCDASLIGRDTALFEALMKVFETKFDSQMIAMLRSMRDFNLYRLVTCKGEATFGFGEAYTLGGEYFETLIPRQGGGHQK